MKVVNSPDTVDLPYGPLIQLPTAIAIAGVGALSSAVTALLAYLGKRGSGKIVIRGASGASVEIPRGTPKEEVDFYVKKAHELDCKTSSITDAFAITVDVRKDT
jgi:hypothetical protein